MRIPLFETAQSGVQWLADRVWKVEHAFERANAASQKAQNTRLRIVLIALGLALAYAGLMVCATFASLFNSPGQVAAMAGEAHARAQIVDRNGQLLASDVNDYDLFVDPTEMTVPDRALVRQSLGALFPTVSADQMDKVFAAQGPVRLTGSLSEAERDRILNFGLPGISFQAQRVREYPLANTGAVYIGMTQRGGEGLSGVEKAMQTQITSQALHDDQPVQVAMDLRVQGALENELRAVALEQQVQGAVGIITNVRTGEVLAMASYPDFDLNHPGAVSEDAKRNRAAVDRYEVGSIFKVVSIAAGLDAGTATLNSTYDGRQPLQLGSRLIHDEHSSSELLSLTDVFIRSSNIGTSRVALDVGADRMVKYYQALGLLHHADIELGEPASPILPQRWSDSSLVSSAFGQSMAITPLSYAEAAGAVLNGGCLRPLTLRKYDGQPLSCARVLKPETSVTMLDLMRQNVLKGTGTRANAPGLRVGGKTGTAQKPVAGHYTADDISSFAAVFPVDGPVDSDRYLVLVMYDSPQSAAGSNGSRQGGYVAAPVAGRIIDRIAPFLGVERKVDKFSGPQWDKAPVAVTGDEH